MVIILLNKPAKWVDVQYINVPELSRVDSQLPAWSDELRFERKSLMKPCLGWEWAMGMAKTFTCSIISCSPGSEMGSYLSLSLHLSTFLFCFSSGFNLSSSISPPVREGWWVLTFQLNRRHDSSGWEKNVISFLCTSLPESLILLTALHDTLFRSIKRWLKGFFFSSSSKGCYFLL